MGKRRTGTPSPSRETFLTRPLDLGLVLDSNSGLGLDLLVSGDPHEQIITCSVMCWQSTENKKKAKQHTPIVQDGNMPHRQRLEVDRVNHAPHECTDAMFLSRLAGAGIRPAGDKANRPWKRLATGDMDVDDAPARPARPASGFSAF
ncbi:hypothetical protein N8I77_004796 [Diaporthe amygdali]|uniref:Uncharacterized protein n=1 Tax=Phomopsis amygdali TaxID=1214568 RepID=A0AAD9SLP2_PHOAM|nr:hypothetical protein N8I77_004796 [Diaporthe amygdali]